MKKAAVLLCIFAGLHCATCSTSVAGTTLVVHNKELDAVYAEHLLIMPPELRGGNSVTDVFASSADGKEYKHFVLTEADSNLILRLEASN